MREAARAARLDERKRSPAIDLDGIEDGELQG